MQRVEALVHEVEAWPDVEARGLALELVQSLMDFHGAGLERMMETIAQSGEAGQSVFKDFAGDGLVSSLLLLYGLHPLELESRVMQALDKVRPYLASHGGNVELLGVDESVVHLQMQGSCHGCPSSAMTLKLAIEEAIYEAAPDVTAIEVEGVVEQPAHSGLVQLGKSKTREEAAKPANGNGRWAEVSGLDLLALGGVQSLDVSGRSILFCRLGETFYAYDSLCPGCGRNLHTARLVANSLICSTCERHYDVVRAGRGLSHPELQLEPFPLLIEQGQAKIALPN